MKHMNWDFRDDLPIYSQLVQKIKYALVSGELSPGDRLQSVREMALDAKVNPNTMQRALSELEREGLLYTQRTSGRFVTEDIALLGSLKSALADEQIKSFFDSMERIGISESEALKLIENYKENRE